VCRQLRERSTIALIVLSAIDDEHEKVRAFTAGADDYLTKPFASRELVARIRAIRRRSQRVTLEHRIELEGLAIDFARRVVHRDGEEIHLTSTEFRLLGVMLRERGRVLTHEALLRQVWGPSHMDDTRPLRTHIANLRRKIAHLTFARSTASAIASSNPARAAR
jgi:two-component system KDP operon response regulator KdpE